jgi:hypothetical protein
MIGELDIVVLTRDIDEHGLRRGDAGTIVHSYRDGAAFEVEFVTNGGEMVAVLTLTPDEIRLKEKNEILRLREPT